MAKNAESVIQGLNIIPTTVDNTLSNEQSPLSDDINHNDFIEAQIAMWTNFQFPNPSTLPLSSSVSASASAHHHHHHPDHNAIDEDDERIFSPERDTASRSRHKTLPVEDFPSDHFFGNVGASLAHHHHLGSHAAAHERAKFQQLQQHLLHSNNTNNNSSSSNNNGNHDNNAAANANDMGNMFSFFPIDDMNLTPALVDPFLNPSDVAAGVTGGGGYLPPLTIRHPTHGRPHPQQQHSAFPGPGHSNMPQLQMQHQQQQTIDPATTTLGHHRRVTLPHPPLPSPTSPSTKRKQKKGSISSSRNVIIPVDHDYTTAPPSAIGGDDEMDHDSYRLHSQEHDDSSNGNGMDVLDDLHPLPPQLDASGNPIPYSAAEDKRRRNTLASARFRQKKKEREAAMERKARELDERVSGLERECESLRKENRMLRGLLVDGVPAGLTTNTSIPNSSSDSNSNSNANSNAATSSSSNSAEEISDGISNAIGAGASVAFLEQLVRMLKDANSGILSSNGNASGSGKGQQAAPTPTNGQTGTTVTGKRKRGGGN